MVGVHPIHLARIEYGQANVTLATLVALARAYGVELQELFRTAPRE
jgi:transcriptional regulator with XRE-family HTH domain